MNSLLKREINLKLRNFNGFHVGLDIGGSLTKVAIALNKENVNLNNKILNNFEFSDNFNIEDKTFFIKMYKTSKFQSETLPFLKSKLFIFKFKRNKRRIQV